MGVKTILIVDDSATIRQVDYATLIKVGDEVVVASNGKEAGAGNLKSAQHRIAAPQPTPASPPRPWHTTAVAKKAAHHSCASLT
ncbi:MAG: hypothetical protein V7629_12815 [Motiliproteus sp.]